MQVPSSRINTIISTLSTGTEGDADHRDGAPARLIAAELRLANPDLALSELGRCATPSTTKDSVAECN